jgi:hypothetical protein
MIPEIKSRKVFHLIWFFYLGFVLRGTGLNIISRGEDFSIDAGFAIPALVQLADWIE